MRRRDLHLVSPGAGWVARASAAAAAVAAGDKPSDHADVWRDLKNDLGALSRKKCWYCEARQIRSDNTVDHFRPKSLYPWQAFKKENFRYSCTYCNSRRENPNTGEMEGKGDSFPLMDGSVRATSEAQVAAERPVLIDPCKADEAGYLDFRSDGTPCAAFPADAARKYRAEESIKYYHLDHPELNEQRRLLAVNIGEWVELANKLYPRVGTGDIDLDNAYAGFVTNIARALDDHAELSVFARKMLKTHRTIPWVESLLDAA